MITPLILGHGRAGQAIAKSLAILGVMRPELELAPCVWLSREARLKDEAEKHTRPILCIATPHGRHAKALLEGAEAGFQGLLCEKPACVSIEELSKLREIKTPTGIFHVYRQTWGLQTLKEILTAGTFGEIVSLEGRYWQASTAERVLTKQGKSSSWKNDISLSGPYDAFLDVGTHWVDAVSFLYGTVPKKIKGWRSYVGAETSHRDSHIQLAIEFPNGRALGSISKIVHGSSNHFEINVIGSKMAATWNFLRPDEILIGEGRDARVLTRKTVNPVSQQPPHQGYIDIASRLLDEAFFKKPSPYPRLAANLDLLEIMLLTSWERSE